MMPLTQQVPPPLRVPTVRRFLMLDFEEYVSYMLYYVVERLAKVKPYPQLEVYIRAVQVGLSGEPLCGGALWWRGRRELRPVCLPRSFKIPPPFFFTFAQRVTRPDEYARCAEVIRKACAKYPKQLELLELHGHLEAGTFTDEDEAKAKAFKSQP